MQNLGAAPRPCRIRNRKNALIAGRGLRRVSWKDLSASVDTRAMRGGSKRRAVPAVMWRRKLESILPGDPENITALAKTAMGGRRPRDSGKTHREREAAGSEHGGFSRCRGPTRDRGSGCDGGGGAQERSRSAGSERGARQGEPPCASDQAQTDPRARAIS